MLTAIPNRWPRTFSSIGIGSAILLPIPMLMFFAILGELRTSGIALLEVYQSLTQLKAGLPSTLLVLVGFAVTFIAYVLGEIATILGKDLLVFGGRRESRRHTVRRLASLDNSFLWDRYARRENATDLCAGLTSLAVFYFILLTAIPDFARISPSFPLPSVLSLIVLGILIIAAGSLTAFTAYHLERETIKELDLLDGEVRE